MPHDSGYARQRPPPQQQPATPFGDAAAVATAAAAAAVFRGDATAGAQLLETQRLNLAARWMPGVAAVWDKLRSYFAVSHRYVGLKLRALVVPWIKRAWRRQKLGDQDVVSYALPVDDENAPDLYIPLVSFLTFALVTGYVKGQSGTFTPEVLAHILTSCAGFQLFELTLYSAGLYLSGAGAPLLDLTCYTGYKYVSLCVNMLAGLLAGVRAYYAALLWTALSSSYFMLKTMAQTVPAKTSAAAPRREFLVCGLGLIQGFSIWFLGYNRDL
ncbi:hypothetical protein CTAYLR_004746 [Chrysophaeum taylorii]|uniref:Protein YIF1 n=1 Tax=Chrysophaeum taylorii TaxID=2483200 RepID=A0AAD7XIS7_9STRA|nr:hypothetical protein CTAYLR_004746 [Chrysophaeum taylorii]